MPRSLEPRTLIATAGVADSDEHGNPIKHGHTFAEWLRAAGRPDSVSDYDLRAAWDAGEDPSEYRR